MQQFHLLNKALRNIVTKLTHRACNSPECFSDTHAIPKRNRTFRQHILQADGDMSVLCGGNEYEENIGC